ncbi:MAG TPA: HAD-IA family hydrolase, partial [Bacteroidales bacterium]|nr:HAD-IA family hydrolase [Bacteroidales bacterium]
HQDDYLPYVDGKPRYEGVRSFLESRGITLDYGHPDDGPEAETVCGLGNRKNDFFNQVLQEEGVEVYQSTVELIRAMHGAGMRTAVASSSKNCAQVLERAGLSGLFEARVDGVVSAEIGLNGKPEPDIFLEACRRINGKPWQSMIFEDAVSGVAAGKAGGFGLVVGVAREDNREELLAAGADIVVNDLGEITLDRLTEELGSGQEARTWRLSYHGLDPLKEASREALLTTGNGYFGTRGCLEELAAGGAHYPGTYIAGLYNRLKSRVGDRDVENEDFVNAPNWLPLTFAFGSGPWFDPGSWTLHSFHRSLDLREGVLYREMRVTDPQGHEARVSVERFAGMDVPHYGALRYRIEVAPGTPALRIRSALDASVINAGVERYRSLASLHLKAVEASAKGRSLRLLAQTNQSGTHIAMVARHRILAGGEEVQALPAGTSSPAIAAWEMNLTLLPGEVLEVEKMVSLFTSLESEDPWRAAMEHNARLFSYTSLKERHLKAWDSLWERSRLEVRGDREARFLLRMHTYHLYASASPHNQTFDAGITARGLHGEAYRGHVFWDEIFILPWYTLHFPEISRSLLLYRYRRLGAARRLAAAEGLPGAMFPWQSGSDGREETQVVHLNPLSGTWGADHSSLQRHVSLAIAYNVWDYVHTSGDTAFLEEYGAEMFYEVCRFWAAKARPSEGTGRWSIHGVMGPDEFHEKLPGTDEGGLSDNAYSNLMTAWMLRQASGLWQMLSQETRARLSGVTGVGEKLLAQWQELASSLRLVLSEDGILAQYDGYFDLLELDWEDYRRRYGNIYRMDRLLKAEGRSPDAYKVAKQADTLMTFYNLAPATVEGLIGDMGYSLPEDFLQRNLEYYLARASHGSTLSRVVHAYLARLAGKDGLAWDLYRDALGSDYQDIQGGTTGEGIHAGVMAGTLMIALTAYAGLDFRAAVPALHPSLPPEWESLEFTVTLRGRVWDFLLEHGRARVCLRSGEPGAVILVAGQRLEISGGEEHWVNLTS